MPTVVVAALLAGVLGWPSTATAGSPTASAAKSGFGTNWITYHGNSEATGVHAAKTDISPSQPAWTSPVLDGQLFGEPLVADGRIVAATENDTVYVLAANTGKVLWSTHSRDRRAFFGSTLRRYFARGRYHRHSGRRPGSRRNLRRR